MKPSGNCLPVHQGLTGYHLPEIRAQVPLTPKYAIKGKATATVRIIILNSIGAAQNI
jgi:hypothetical protein